MKKISIDLKAAAILMATGMLAGCASRPAVVSSATAQPLPQAYTAVGLEGVMGATARSLVTQFGQPDLDLREGQARKLQFIGPACVLDAYLYPRSGVEPVVTHVDARLPDGTEMDRSSCVAALSARQQSR